VRISSRPWILVLLLWLTFGMAGVLAAERGRADRKSGDDPTLRRGQAYAHLMRALFSVRRGEVGKGVDELHRAVALVPDSPDLQTEAATLLLRWTGRVGEAERMARRALEIDPEHEGATRFLAEVAASRALGPERDEASRLEAIRLYEQLAEGDTAADPEILQTLVQLRLQAGDLEGGIVAVRRLVKERPGDLRATQTLVQLLLRTGREAEALRVLLAYVVDHPSQEELQGWAEQIANSQRAWPAVVEFLDGHAPPGGRSPVFHLFHGEALYRVGRIGDAADAFGLALEADPQDSRARKDLALAYRAMGRLAEAAEMFEALAAQSPDFPYLHQLLAETLAQQGESGGSLRAYRATLAALAGRDDEIGENHRDSIRRQIAALHLGRGEYDEAAAVLATLEAEEGPLGMEILARSAIERREWDRARSLVRHLAEVGEKGLATLFEGEIALGEGKWTKAQDRLDEAISLLGPHSRANVAALYRQAGRADDGLRTLEAWVRQDPERADARFRLGSYLYELERFDDAERELREAFRLDPVHDRALNFLGYSLAERKIRLDEALGLIERALEIDAWNGAYLDSLGWVYYQMERYEDARAPLERAARELPRDSTVLEHLGDLYDSLGEPGGAVLAWDRALEAGGVTDPAALDRKIRRARTETDRLAAEDGRGSGGPPAR